MGFFTITLNLMMLLYEVIQKCLWFEIIDWEPSTYIGSYEGMKNLAHELPILTLILQVLFNRCFAVGSPLHHWINSLFKEAHRKSQGGISIWTSLH